MGGRDAELCNPCEVVNDGSKLIREGSKFVVINEKEIYRLG